MEFSQAFKEAARRVHLESIDGLRVKLEGSEEREGPYWRYDIAWDRYSHLLDQSCLEPRQTWLWNAMKFRLLWQELPLFRIQANSLNHEGGISDEIWPARELTCYDEGNSIWSEYCHFEEIGAAQWIRHRWKEAGGEFFGNRMIAQVGSEIWTKLSDFGLSFGPLAAYSPFITQKLDCDEIAAIGIGIASKPRPKLLHTIDVDHWWNENYFVLWDRWEWSWNRLHYSREV